MRLALVLLFALTTTNAFADAKYKRTATKTVIPELITAERAWASASGEKEPRAAVIAWEAAALAFDGAVGKAGAAKVEAAYAAVLAWKNAMALDPIAVPPAGSNTATPLTARGTNMLASLLVYSKLAPPDEVPGLLFLRAHILHRHRKHDESVPIFVEIVTRYPEHETAEYAANLILDSLNLQGKYDLLAQWVDTFRANKKLLAKRPDLASLLAKLHIQVLRKRAEVFEASGGKTQDGYRKCAQTYVEAFDANPGYERADELLYNAGVCFERAGEISEAVKLFTAVTKLSRSPLAANARARVERLRPSP